MLKTELDNSRKKTIEYGRKYLIGRTLSLPGFNRAVTFTMRGIKEAANQPHRHFLEKNEAVRNILNVAAESLYIGWRHDDTKRNYIYRYFQITLAGDDSFIVIRENTDTKLIDFYSIVDAMKKE